MLLMDGTVMQLSVPTKILMCQRVPKKSTVLACLTMAKFKMNQRVLNKNADLLKKICLMGTEMQLPIDNIYSGQINYSNQILKSQHITYLKQ